MENQINERFILIGKAPFPLDLELNEDVQVLVKGQSFTATVVGRNEKPTEDGMIDVCYKLKYFSN